MLTEVKLMQPEKTSFSIDVTPSGIVIEVKLEQLRNAPPPIEVTPSGIMKAPFMPEQP